jgi:hypothetical protein
MSIVHNITKSKDTYSLHVSQETEFKLIFISNNNEDIITNKTVKSNTNTILNIYKDGKYKVVLSKQSEDTVIEILFVTNFLLESMNSDILDLMCDPCGKNSKCNDYDVTSRNIHNKLLSYNNIYLKEYGEGYTTTFLNYISEAVKITNCSLQNKINDIILEENIKGVKNEDKELFNIYLFIHWVGFYFSELKTIDTQDLEEIEFIKDKFNYNQIVSCSCDLCFNINELRDLFENTAPDGVEVVPLLTISGLDAATVEVGTSFDTTLIIDFTRGIITTSTGEFIGYATSTLNSIIIKNLLSDEQVLNTSNVSSNPYSALIESYAFPRGVIKYEILGIYTNTTENITETVQKNTESIKVSYYKWQYLGEKDSSTVIGEEVRNLISPQFLETDNYLEFSVVIPANIQEYSFYVPAETSIDILQLGSININITTAFNRCVIDVEDANGDIVKYTKNTLYIGYTGYSYETTLQIKVTPDIMYQGDCIIL